MYVIRDQLPINAAIAAESQYARVWNPAGIFVSDPALQDLPRKCPVMVYSLQVWIITTLGYLRRGTPIELVNLTDQVGERFSLPTIPQDAVQGFNGVRYNGPPFLCEYGCGWWIRKPAVVDTNTVYMRIAWDRK